MPNRLGSGKQLLRSFRELENPLKSDPVVVLIIDPPSIFLLQKRPRGTKNPGAAEFAFDEGIASVFQVKDNIGVHSITVPVVRNPAAS